MDASLQSADSAMEFRKPFGDAVNRKYRRHSPIGGSPPHGSPKRDGSDSPKLTGLDSERVYENHSRSDHGREVENNSDKSNKHSDKHYNRSSHGYSRHDDYVRNNKHNDNERSHRSSWESRDRPYSDKSRSRDHFQDFDKFSRDRNDGLTHKGKERGYRSREKAGDDDKRDSRRSIGDDRGDRMQHDEGKNHDKERFKSGVQPIGHRNFIKEGKKKYDDVENQREKYGSENLESPSRKQKIGVEREDGKRKRVSKFTSAAEVDVKASEDVKTITGQGLVNVPGAASDFNAAKSASLKAAELVNKNLVGGVGTGLMTADQKKKLLWGNKKATAAEETSHRWDSSTFSDQERQEKFNKLMGVKGDPNKGGSNVIGAEKQRELQLDLEKQYTAGLRRRDGRTVGLGL